MINSILVNPDDTVAVVTTPISKGDNVTYLRANNEITITALNHIPIYHKIAIKGVKKGNPVLKYGEKIGHATLDIEVGEHVHTQNLSDVEHRNGANE
jgi:altronate dehydratase small subunit